MIKYLKDLIFLLYLYKNIFRIEKKNEIKVSLDFLF